MPTYDYVCDACGHRFEEFQNITAPVLTKCPACKKKKLRRLFGTGAAIVFKGSGFYQTDYRSEGYKQAQAADGKQSDGGGGKSGSETASAPAGGGAGGATTPATSGGASASGTSAKGPSAKGSEKPGRKSSGKSDKS